MYDRIIKRLPTLRHLFLFFSLIGAKGCHLSDTPHGFCIFFFFSQAMMVEMMIYRHKWNDGLNLVTKWLADKINAKVME